MHTYARNMRDQGSASTAVMEKKLHGAGIFSRMVVGTTVQLRGIACGNIHIKGLIEHPLKSVGIGLGPKLPQFLIELTPVILSVQTTTLC